MSSGLRLMAAPRLAFTCHAINPIEKTMPTPAAIQALVVEFKTVFLSKGRIEYQFQLGFCDDFPAKIGTLNTVMQTISSVPVRATRRPSMMDEQRPQGNRPRPC